MESPEPDARPPAYGRVMLTLLADSTHTNLLGNVHGGVVMRLADTAAGAAASRHSSSAAVTVFMDEMAFLAPVHVGDIIRATARVNWAGRTSMEVGVRVEAEPWNRAGVAPVHVATAYFVFVAIDADGTPRDVPGLRADTPEDERRVREAQIRRAHRLAKKAEILDSRDVQSPG